MPDATKRILIVDDKECIRTTMSLVLTEMGYQVRSVGDGLAALRAIRKDTPEILLSDLNMPGMSGFELLSVVRLRFPAILVIAMSGAFSGNEVPSGVPADAFYQKGSSPTALLQILKAPPRTKRPVPQPYRAPAPLSIQRNGNGLSGKAEVAITCPECLRTFPQVLDCSRLHFVPKRTVSIAAIRFSSKSSSRQIGCLFRLFAGETALLRGHRICPPSAIEYNKKELDLCARLLS